MTIGKIRKLRRKIEIVNGINQIEPYFESFMTRAITFRKNPKAFYFSDDVFNAKKLNGEVLKISSVSNFSCEVVR